MDSSENQTIKKQTETPGFLGNLVNAYVDARADSGHPVAVALQSQMNPEAYNARIENKKRSQELARLAYEDEKERLSQAKNDRALQRENQKAIRDLNILRLQDAQHITWKKNFENDARNAQNALDTAVDKNALNFTGQAIYDNSKAVKQFIEARAIVQAFNRSPEEGKYALNSAGWGLEQNPDGKEYIVSADGKLKIPADGETLNGMFADITSRMRDDIAAATARGTDALTMEQKNIQRILNLNDNVKAFSSPGEALGAYRKFYNQVDKNGTPVYSKEAKLHHIVSGTVSLAIEDGIITEPEKAALIPLFSASLKKWGMEIAWGDSADTTKVKLPNGGGEVSLKTFARAFAQDDVIMGDWESLVARKKAANQLQAIEVAKAQADLRYKNALAANKEKEVGGNSGAVSETADLDDTSKGLYNAGEKGLKEYGVSIPAVEGKSKSDLTIVFGTALTLAKQKFAETGSYSDAQKTLASELDSVDWPKNEIPDLWSAAGEEQEIKMLEERNRVLRDKLNEDRKAGNFKSEMVTTADDPGAGDIDKAIPRSVRIESKTSREYKRNIDRIGELRKKLHQREQSKKQAAEYRKKSKEAGHLLSKAAKDKR